MKLFKRSLTFILSLIMIIGLTGTTFQNFFVSAATPLSLTTMEYILDNETDGFANGTVTITSPIANKGLECIMYWADANGTPLPDYTSLARFKITGITTNHKMTTHTIIPEGAKKLIAYAYDNGTLSSKAVSVTLPSNSDFKFNSNELITEFQIVSDIHVSPVNTISRDHFLSMLNDIKANSPKSAGIFINGDISDRGLVEDYEDVLNLYNSVSNIPKMYISIGNHDWWYSNNIDQMFQKYVTKYNPDIVTDTVYYDTWVDGFHFIILGSETDTCEANLSDAQLAWFDALLKEDSKNNPDKPVFVLLHQGLFNGVAGGLPQQNWDGVLQEEQFRNIVSQHQQVLLFSGHSHWELNSEGTMNAGDKTTPVAFNTASVSYLWEGETEADGEYVEGSQGYYVRVYKDKILFLGREFVKNKFIPSACFVVENQTVTSPKTSYTLSVGDSVNMGASTTSEESIVYQSSNPQVATVDKNGNIVAFRTGEATITATVLPSDTKTAGRTSVNVTVTKDGNAPANLPYDFYANISYSDNTQSTGYATSFSDNWVGAVSLSTDNLWRFTKLSDGTYKITYKGDDDIALKNIWTGDYFWVATSPYSNRKDNLDYHWYVYTNPDGSIGMRPANICTVGDGTGFTLDVNTSYAEKYLYFIPSSYSATKTQQFSINQILNIESHQYPNTVTMNNSSYYLNLWGEIDTIPRGWMCQKDNWFFYDNSGHMYTGWLNDGGHTYLLNPINGIMITGWYLLDGTTWYYFDGSGKMLTGLQLINNEYYYMDQSGAMTVGWQWIVDAWYYFNPANGIMFRNGDYYIDGAWHSFRADGTWIGEVNK